MVLARQPENQGTREARQSWEQWAGSREAGPCLTSLILDLVLVSYCNHNGTSGTDFAHAGVAPFGGGCNLVELDLQRIKLASKSNGPLERSSPSAFPQARAAD